MRLSSRRTGIIIVAAGESQRMGTDKIMLPLAGKPLIAWSIDICQQCKDIDKIVLVLNSRNIDSGRQLCEEYGWTKVAAICTGGQRRQDSVKKGLQRLINCDWIITHDGARPFLTDALIRNGLDAAHETGAAVAAVSLKDTIKMVDVDQFVTDTLDRSVLRTVQTPQVFRFDIISRAYSLLLVM